MKSTNPNFTIGGTIATFFKGYAWAFLVSFFVAFIIGVACSLLGVSLEIAIIATMVITIPLALAWHISYCVIKRPADDVASYTATMVGTYFVFNGIFWAVLTLIGNSMVKA